MALEHPSIMTVEEYFALEERDSETRYEYIDGYIYAMSGGTINHATIGGNIYATLRNLLKGSRCRVFNSDVRVQVSETCYFYPDVTVSCDPRNRGTNPALESPRVVFEVLSPSTQAKDRSWKLERYLSCPTLEEYLLVDTKSQHIEIYLRYEDMWQNFIFGPGSEVELQSLGVQFPIEDVYEDVEFGEEAVEEEESTD